MKKLKIIGAGIGRTGTLSLKHALEELGFAPCYHMQEAVKHPWHIPIWQKAINGKKVRWKKIFRNYNASVDYPACLFYKELLKEYPNAKIILTVRDPDAWYESTMKTIYQVPKKFPVWMRRLIPPLGWFVELNDDMIWKKKFNNSFENKNLAIETFLRHNEEVIKSIPPEKLLIHKIDEGWEPICQFLGVPVPGKAFPQTNESAKLSRWIRCVHFAVYLYTLILVLILCFLLISLL